VNHVAPPSPEALLEALPLPLLLFGPDRALRLANPAFLAFAGIPAGKLAPGLPCDECARLLAYRGLFGSGDPEQLAQQMVRLDRSRPFRLLLHGMDGRTIEIHSAPVSDGGFLVQWVEVTALAVAQGEAEARAQLLARVVGGLATGVAAFGPDMRLQLANPAYGALVGLPAPLLREGISAAEIVHLLAARGEFAALPPDLVAQLRHHAAGGGPPVIRRRRPTGQVVETRATRLPDGGMLLEVLDATASQSAEDEARRRATVLDSILDALPVGVCVYDAEFRVTMANRAHRAMVGVGAPAPGDTLAEVLRRQAAAGMFGDADIEALIAEELAFRRGAPAERVRRREDGLILSQRVAPMPDGGHVSVVTDIRALAAAEAEARAQAALLRALVENLPIGARLYDASERLVAFNDLGVRLVGLAPGELRLGMTAAEVIALQEGKGEFASAPGFLPSIAGLDRRRPLLYRRTRPDGTVLEVRSGPMPGGGFLVTLQDVTPLVRAEEEARARAELLRAMIDNSEAGVLLFDAEERLAAANAAAMRLEGIGEEDLARRLSRRDLLERVAARGGFAGPGTSQAEAMALPAASRRDYRRRAADGSVVDVSARPMPGGGFVVTLRDVTQLARAEEEARHRAALLQGMIENASYGIMLYDAAHRFVAGNALALRLIGLDPAAIRPGVAYADILAEQVARDEFDEATRQMLLAVDRSRPHGYRRVRTDGTVLDIESKPMPDGGFVISFIDVTALVRAEAEARQRAALQAAMLDNMRHGLALFDADSRVIAANPLAARLTGLPPEAFRPGASMAELRAAQIAAGEFTEAEAETRGFAALDSTPLRYTRRRPDGSIIEVTTDRTPEGFFVRTYSDVTEDRRIRADLEAARAAAEAAARAKSRFLATMTHELRTPLNAVIGFADLLKTPQPAEAVAEYAGLIADAGRELLGLIDQILDVARSETGGLPVQPGPVDLAGLLARVVGAKRPAAAASGIALSLDLPPGLPGITADPARLEQVLHGLLSNALKFTGSGGRVAVTAARGPDGEILVRVADSGIGIAPAALPRVFEPFAQLDQGRARRYAGSGIGLYLARSIAEAMGMRLTLSSREGEGTVATLLIPPELVQLPEKGSA
jgi:signal transduction histidine kinase